MSEGDFEIVYNMCKNFVDICNQDKELRDIIFEIDSSSILEVGDIDSSNYDIVEMVSYTENIGMEYLNIKKFFAQMLFDEQIVLLDEMRTNLEDFGKTLNDMKKEIEEDTNDL